MANLITCGDVGKFSKKIDIADGDTKAKFDSLITQASAAIEKWCDRTFALTEYKQWYDGNGTCYLKLDDYPVTRLYQVACGTQDLARLSYTGSEPEAFASCDGATLTLVAGSATDLTLSSYATATALKTAVENVTGWTLAIFSGMDSYSPAKMQPFSGYVEGAGNEIDLQIPDEAITARMADRAEWLVEGSFPHGKSNIFVWYKAGFATVPEDVQLVATRIVVDLYYASNRDSTMKGEKLGDYSYTAGGSADGVDMQNIVESYADTLRRYKRVEMA